MSTTDPGHALVVAAFGRHNLIETAQGARLIAHPKGKKNQAVVGDRVVWVPTGDEARIESVLPRRNLFYRQDEVRTKSFAANLDQILILIAAEPEYSEGQLSRALIAAEAQGLPALIALNKSDLPIPFAQAWSRLAPYRQMGYAMWPLALASRHESVQGPDEWAALHQALRGCSTLVLGPSGSGKSTLINRLVPEAAAQTGEISQALQSGKHTTTHTRWYWADAPHGQEPRTAVIDSPGFQEFGLQHIAPAGLAACMPDFRPFLGGCKFHNCSHLHEPGCAVLAQLQTPQGAAGPGIHPRRHALYAQLHAELSQPPRW